MDVIRRLLSFIEKRDRGGSPDPLALEWMNGDYFAAATMACISSISSWVQMPSSTICL